MGDDDPVIVRWIDDPTSDLYAAHQDLKRLNDRFMRYGLTVLLIDKETRIPLELIYQIDLRD